MNKKMLGIALVLLTIFAVGVVFAAGADISRTATTVTVTNTNTRGNIQGNVCIYLIHRNGTNKTTDDFPYGPIRPGRTATYRIPSQYAGDWTIYDASEISCFVIPESESE